MSFFFLTRPENDLSAKKDNTNGNRILKNDKSSGAKLDNSIKGSFLQKILCLQTIAKFFLKKWVDSIVWEYDKSIIFCGKKLPFVRKWDINYFGDWKQILYHFEKEKENNRRKCESIQKRDN